MFISFNIGVFGCQILGLTALTIATSTSDPNNSSSSNHSSSTQVPRFHLTLAPNIEPGNYYVDGSIILDGSFAANETLLVLPKSIASRPTAQYGPDGIIARDTQGPLALAYLEEDLGPFGLPSSSWTAQRPVQGPISFNFTARPAIVRNDTLPGPSFDLRNGTGGFTGSMWALVPAHKPLSQGDLNITVSWDIPDDTGAAFTWADGLGPHSHSFTGPMSELLQTFFIVGNVTALPSVPTDAGSKTTFGMYRLAEQNPPPPFDLDETSAFVKKFLAFSSEFWQDDSGQPYRVFLRFDQERAGGPGGTALPRAFTIGYNGAHGVTQHYIDTLLAHEMTHNWTPWTGDTAAEQSRYNEGAAEYWSLRLLWRAGLLTAGEYLAEVNSRAVGYYTNPAVNMSDADAQAVAWEFRPAQTIPYGRGMIHLTNMDAQIRAASAGAQSLDDLAVAYLKRCGGVAACGGDEWFPLVADMLGQAAVDEWRRVSTGHPLVRPQEGSLGPCFDVVQNGTNPTIYIWRPKEGQSIDGEGCRI